MPEPYDIRTMRYCRDLCRRASAKKNKCRNERAIGLSLGTVIGLECGALIIDDAITRQQARQRKAGKK